MKNLELLIVLIFVLMIMFTGCASEPEDRSLNLLDNEYETQLLEICSKLDDEEINRVILKAFNSEYLKLDSTLIVNNEGLEPFLQLLVITSRKINEKVYETEPLLKIPFGRRYAVIQRVFFEEHTLRKVVIVMEIDEEDRIKDPYHLYVFDVRSKLLYRGEGVPKAAAYEVESYEYGRQPDIIKER